MIPYLALSDTALFTQLNPTEIEQLLTAMKAEIKYYQKDEMIVYEQNEVHELGIIISGTAISSKLNILGKEIIVTHHHSGGYSALLTALSIQRKCPMSIRALEPLTMLSIPRENLFTYYPEQTRVHQLFLSNLFDSVAERALELHDRNDCLIMPTVREKVLTLLSSIAKEKQTTSFTIPFNREEMAQYLDVDRSALSRELSAMQKDGIITFHKNFFEIKSKTILR
ncbi:transcriptional regulator [Enterococcus sp. JM4C]|uniref:Crp/Fnr family transcriptional regulator n=1 Tax=Candidatus Enterococcus huntleyi TaxID=1857217 RepID=UPI00137B0A27|nr:Crp/Fnr family transcriptional regulator [Enterococcus sp. JM4C]KAF1296293.1 transcriptional regulator [Enterococcus sp. JM4C]